MLSKRSLLGSASALVASAFAGNADGASNNGESPDSAVINNYFLGLQAPKLPAPGSTQGAPQAAPDATINGRTYACTTTHYTLKTNSEKIITFQPDIGALWRV